MGLRGPKKGEGGRPPIPFDKEQFERMAAISCTKLEIASIFNMSEDTLEGKVAEAYDGETFSAVYKKHQGTGKQSLRRMQLQAAEKGNVAMLIWLGKQWLGQSDKQELTGKDGEPIAFTEIKRVILDPRTPNA